MKQKKEERERKLWNKKELSGKNKSRKRYQSRKCYSKKENERQIEKEQWQLKKGYEEWLIVRDRQTDRERALMT